MLDGALPCSAAEWAAMARRRSRDIHASGRTPILVGGTGLYLRTLLDGIAPVPAIDPDVRERVREAPVEANRAKLETLDPERSGAAQPADTARINRALEVILSTGRTLAEWQQQREGGIAGEVELRPLILLPPRKWLYARCDDRFARMIERGAVGEVEALLARKLNPNLPVMRAIGVARTLGLSRSGKLRSMRPSRRASRRRADTPSANIPGLRTSRRRIGRASAKRSTASGSAKRWLSFNAKD